jgi:hypothetical protein
MHKTLVLTPLFVLVFLAGCGKKETAKAPEPVQNVVTDYVDRGRVTMEKAQVAAEVQNARIQQQNAQMNAPGEPE